MTDIGRTSVLSAQKVALYDVKQKIRLSMLKQLDVIPPQKKQELGKQATSKLVHRLKKIKLLSSKSACTVALFANKNDEISTAYFDYFLQIKKFHRVYPEFTKNKLHFRSIPQEIKAREMHKDKFGIPTPDLSWAVYTSQNIRIVLVPGLAFDKNFYRVGRGKGYYDAYISQARRSALFTGQKAPLFIGFFLDFQEIDHCPHNSLDQQLDGYCTPEQGLILKEKP